MTPLVYGPWSQLHSQQADTSLGIPRTLQSEAGDQVPPTSRNSLGPSSKPTPALRYLELFNQPPQDPVPPSSPKVGEHQLCDTLEPIASHVRNCYTPNPNPKQNSMPTLDLGRLGSAIIHLRTQLCPTSEPALALGPGFHNQLHHDLALPVSSSLHTRQGLANHQIRGQSRLPGGPQ